MKFHEYLLVSLAEECAEVAQRATKALRFGLDETQPGQPISNAVRLVDELEDLALIVDLLRAGGHIPPRDAISLIPLIKRKAERRAKVFKFMDYAEECGTLSQEADRASGNVLCKTCNKEYREHPMGGPLGNVGGAEHFQFLHRLCDGRLVKL